MGRGSRSHVFSCVSGTLVAGSGNGWTTELGLSVQGDSRIVLRPSSVLCNTSLSYYLAVLGITLFTVRTTIVSNMVTYLPR